MYGYSYSPSPYFSGVGYPAVFSRIVGRRRSIHVNDIDKRCLLRPATFPPPFNFDSQRFEKDMTATTQPTVSGLSATRYSPPASASAVRFAATTDNIGEEEEDSDGGEQDAHARSFNANKASSSRMEHFLDLADSGNRMSTSPELLARLEKKRIEHEKQRARQQSIFEAQMRQLEAKQAAEEAELLGVSSGSSAASTSPDPRSRPKSKPSASAPGTPPRSPNPANASSSEDDVTAPDHKKDKYSRMSRSIPELPRQSNLTKSVHIEGTSPKESSRFSRSKSGSDLASFSDGVYSAFPAFSPIAPGGKTAPASPVNYRTNGVGTNGHVSRREASENDARTRYAPSKTKSVPGSRRHSGDDARDSASEGTEALTENMRNINIKDAPARQVHAGSVSNDAGLLTSFLLDDDADDMQTFGGRYLAMNTEDDKFPILIRRDDFPGILSASSAALDLAPLSQTPPRSSGFRLQQAQASSRGSEWPLYSQSSDNLKSQGQALQTGFTIPQKSHSLGPQASSPSNTRGYSGAPGSGRASPLAEMSPTKRSGTMPATPSSPEDGRLSKRASLIGTPVAAQGLNGMSGSVHGTPFTATNFNYGEAQSGFFPYAQDHQYGQDYDARFGQNATFTRTPQSAVNLNSSYPGSASRRDEANRFAGLRLEDFQGDMASLCKDQHGCRFLQRKLEEGNPAYRDMIFGEVYPYFADLMVDSFGNYLAQRLLEFSTDEQKDVILSSIHDDLVNISLNIHGTRAIQRLIDHLSTQRHVQSFVNALTPHVVTLIKDLNGNHVIQKCLNTLKPEDNQFIFNAVATNCVEVATHRHGCCVLQRCIDHASESQRIQVVTEITYQCLTLVQDPFSNYVVQYCLEFDRRFVDAIIRQFAGHVCALSCHKFSSNVIEKCIRTAEPEGRRLLISELLDPGRLERLVKDNFGNYVVQTACDFADPIQRDQLVAIIRPLLPMIRNTPYGKRIAARIQKVTQSSNRYPSYGMPAGFNYGPPPPQPPVYGGLPPPLGAAHLDPFHASMSQQGQPFAANANRSYLPQPAQYTGGLAANDFAPPNVSSFSPFQ